MDTIYSKTRKAIRIISFKDKDEPHIPLFIKQSILPVDKNLELKQASFMWKLWNEMLPPSLAKNFRISRNQITLSHNRLDTSAKHITYAGPRIWAQLPDNIKKITFQKSFSKTLQKHLIENLS